MPGSARQETRYTFERGLSTVLMASSRRRSFGTLDNVWLAPDDEGAIQAMPGYTKVNSVEISGAAFHGTAIAIATDGTRYNLISYLSGGSIRIISMAPDGTVTNIVTEATTPAITVPDFSAVVAGNAIYFANGTDTAGRYDLGTTTLAASGLGRPDDDAGWGSMADPATSSGTNAVKGIVTYYLSKVTGAVPNEVEGALSSAIGPVNCGDGQDVTLDLSVLPTNTYRVYRTLADRSQPYYVAEVTGGVDYLDTTPDDNLQDYPRYHGDVQSTDIVSLLYFNNRVWGWTAGGLLLWTDPARGTETSAFQSWWNTENGNQAPINLQDGDTGTVLVRIPGAFLCGKKNHIYRVVGRDAAELQVQETMVATQEGRTVGFVSQQAVEPCGDFGLAFYWNRGVYMIGSSGFAEYISYPIEDDLLDIRNQDEADGVYLGFYPKRRHLHVSVPLSAGVTPTHEYIYDFDRGEWIGRRSTGFRGYLSTQDANGNEEFWMMGASDGFVYKHDDGQTAAGTAIATTARLPLFFGRGPGTQLYSNYFDIEFEPQASGNLTWTVAANGTTSNTETGSISMVKANFIRHLVRINLRKHRAARELSLKLSSEADQPQWKVYSVVGGGHDRGSRSR